MFNIKLLNLIAGAAIALMNPASAVAGGPDRVSILFGSRHVNESTAIVRGGRGFNETNPGVFLTWKDNRFGYTGGIYHNSYGRTSISGTVSYDIIQRGELEVGLFAGLAYYPHDGRTFAAHIGDVIPIGGAQIRYKNIFAQIIPSDGAAASAIVSFGLTFEVSK